MKRQIRIIVSALLILTMVFGFNGVAAFADGEDGTTAPEGNTTAEYTLSKTATPLDQDNMSNVKLTVGGTEEVEDVDIVFVLGGGTAPQLVSDIKDAIRPILEAGATVKVGFVVFADRPDDIAVDLNSEEAVLTAENLDEKIDAFIKKATQKEAATNLEGALIKARDMLKADTSVKPENKHMFVISTGLTYFFNDTDGYEATIAQQNSAKQYVWGNTTWQKIRVKWVTNTSTKKSSYPVHPGYKNDWNAYWSDIKEWIAKDGNKYVYSIGNRTYMEWKASNSAGSNQNTGMQILSPAVEPGHYIPSFEWGLDPTVETNTAAQHAMNYERAQYDAWVIYEEMETPIGESFTTVYTDPEERSVVEGLGYNCYAIGSMPDYWMNGSSNLVDAPNKIDSSIQIGHSFMNFLNNGEPVPMYTEALGEDSFNSVIQKFTYTIAGGTKVEDCMGYGDGYNFDFVDDADTIKLTVGSKEYTTTEVEPVEGAASSYEFTAPGAETATFYLDYYKGNGLDEEHFIWTFDQKVYVDIEGVSLNYKVKLVEKAESSETQYGETNKYAILYPVDIEKNENEPVYFDKPVIDLDGEPEEETTPPEEETTPPEQDEPTPPEQDEPTPPEQDEPTPPEQDEPTPPEQDEPTPPEEEVTVPEEEEAAPPETDVLVPVEKVETPTVEEAVPEAPVKEEPQKTVEAEKAPAEEPEAPAEDAVQTGDNFALANLLLLAAGALVTMFAMVFRRRTE